MGRTLEELFKTKRLVDGQTAQQKYEIRDSKQNPITPGNSLLNLSFKGASGIRKGSSSNNNRLKETFIESEIRGLRMIHNLSSPIVYGTDIIRFKKKSTKLVDTMKDSVNPNQSSGIVGNLFNKIENFGLRTLSKIGVVFPDHLIPTKISLNEKFKGGKEPDTMTTLAEIKKDAKGSISGKIIKNVKGTPKQILNGVVGTSVDLLKKEVRKKLFGAPKEGAQNLAKKNENETQYDSFANYTSTIDAYSEDIAKRNDLSSLQLEKIKYKKKTEKDAISKISKDIPKYEPKGLPVQPNLGGKLNLDVNRFNIGGKVATIKDGVASNLTAARKDGQKSLSSLNYKIGDVKPSAENAESAVNPIIKYSETVDESADDIKLRNDLSSKLNTLIEAKKAASTDKKETTSPNPGSPIKKADLSSNKKLVDDEKSLSDKKNKEKLNEGRKEGQQKSSNKDEEAVKANIINKYDNSIKYDETVDESQEDITLRNDLSSKLQAIIDIRQEMEEGERKGLSPLTRENISKNQYSRFKNKLKESNKPISLKNRYGIESKDRLDFLNEKTQYDGETLKLKDGTILDDYDFITLKFRSKASGKSVNFRATLSGISETVSPSWDSGKFIGNPFSYYTYSGIERSVSFNFKIYSTTPLQHVAAWQRINFLTGLAYPQGYSGAYAIPPFVSFTLGSWYKNKSCFIESLSYTVDDNGGWEIGSIGVGEDSPIGLNGSTVSMKEYKLPIIIDVAITLKFVESVGTSQGGQFYGFDKLPKTQESNGTSNATGQKLDDSNNNENLQTSNDDEEVPTVKKKLPAKKVEPVAQNNDKQTGGSGATEKTKENEAAITTPKLPNYKIKAFTSGGDLIGQIYADDILIDETSYYSSFTNSYSDETGKTTVTTGEDAVRQSLKFSVTRMGCYSKKDGKFYPASDNVTVS